jgi:hypothetical protein
MNIPVFVEGILLVLSWFVIVYFLAFVVSSYYEMLDQQIKWKRDDDEFNDALKKFEEDNVILSKEEYEELKKVN